MAEETSPTAAAAENPWLDLRHYLEGDEARFFGRDREGTALTRLVRQETLTVFYGVSGLGKTSLLLAGLFPELRKARFMPIRWLVGRADRNAPLTGPLLAAFFRDAQERAIEAPAPASGETLWSYFHRRDAQFWDRAVRSVTPVLVLDQFEEVFTTHAWSPERGDSPISRFLEELGQLIENRPPEMPRETVGTYDSRPVPLHVVLSLRENYLAPLQALSRFIPTLRRNEMRLLRLRKEDARQVVLGRSGEWKNHFSEEAPSAVLDAVGDVRREALEAVGDRDDGVDPAILSVFLHRLFERARAAGGKITPALVAQHRGNVLDSLYTDALAQVAAAGCDAAELARTQQFLEERLIAGQQPPFRVRLPVAVADERKVPRRALAALREARLVTADGPLEARGDVSERDAARTLVELTHDCLCDVLLRRLEVRRVAEAARAAEEAQRKLDDETKLRERAEAARGRAFFFMRVAGFLLAVAIATIGWGVVQHERGMLAATQVRTLEEQAGQLEDDKKNLAEQIADAQKQAAAQKREFSETEERLRREQKQVEADLGRTVARRDVELAELMIDRAIEARGDDSQRNANASARFDEALNTLVAQPASETAELRNRLGEKGQQLLELFKGMRARLETEVGVSEEVISARTIRTSIPLHHERSVLWCVFAPPGQSAPDAQHAERIVTASADKTVGIWTLAGASVRRLPGSTDGVNMVSFSPDGTRLAAASNGSTVRLYDLSKPSGLARAYSKHSDSVTCAVFSPDGKYIASASADRTVQIFNAETLERVHVSPLQGPGETYTFVSFAPDGRLVVSSCDDGGVGRQRLLDLVPRRWSGSTSTCVRTATPRSSPGATTRCGKTTSARR